MKIKLYHYKDIVELHYKFLNILSLICYNSDYYCFCDKYQGCEMDYHTGRDLCLLCRIKTYFPHDLMSFEEYLDCNQFNLSKLKTYSFRLSPFWMECYHIDNRSSEAFSGQSFWSCLDNKQVKKVNSLWKKLSRKILNLKKLKGKGKYFNLFLWTL